MIKLTKEEREKIRAAINEAERKTSGEFVTVIAQQSDSYFYVPVLWASLLTLMAAPFIIYILNINSASLVFDIQAITFVVLNLLFQINAVKLMLVPKNLRKMQAEKMAFEQFYRNGVSNTKLRAGILFFVSYAEKHVEIIADEGINKLVKEGEWQHIVERFIEHVKNGTVCDGFIESIETCSKILAEHFPGQKDDVNELSDRLIEL